MFTFDEKIDFNGEEMNVAQVYFQMMKEQGVSGREAVRQICDAIGIKAASNYKYQWADEDVTRPIPPAAVKEMQRRVAMYAAQKAGIRASGDRIMMFADMLSPKVKKPSDTEGSN
ncbi:hypothetical protein ACNO5E_14225 [Vibrio parahaemolyticus]|uniref:hypothetical protein n=1 Tax=Vibrio parahaemolyticus TaxID=670 RepID=UPI0008135AFC|nr:hypothetical protein [Vibrio parahaemolyticus]OCP68476.1 hypothetical protein AKH08_16840 [Vibrio parahaemolyticus]